jgi:hypothetical protein
MGKSAESRTKETHFKDKTTCMIRIALTGQERGIFWKKLGSKTYLFG